MNIEEQLSRLGFAQLYFQAAKVRHGDLSDFFAKCVDAADGAIVEPANLHGEHLQPAIAAATELLEFLERAASYLNETDRYRSADTRPPNPA